MLRCRRRSEEFESTSIYGGLVAAAYIFSDFPTEWYTDRMRGRRGGRQNVEKMQKIDYISDLYYARFSPLTHSLLSGATHKKKFRFT